MNDVQDQVGTGLAERCGMEARSLDRRRHPRHMPLREITGKVKSTMDFRIIDISEGGLLVETRLGLPPATVCELKVPYKGTAISFKAAVRRCRAQLTKTDGGCKVAYRSGLEFVNLDAEGTAMVQEIITSACADGEIGKGTVTMSDEKHDRKTAISV